ncbi:MAG: hypothetical protein EZS28_049915, partial [Streblomastix strix]
MSDRNLSLDGDSDTW